LVYKKIVSLIDKRKKMIAEEWMGKVRETEYMPTYNQYSDNELTRRAEKLVKNLLIFLQAEGSLRDVGEYFVNLGKIRYNEKFPLSEIQFAVYLTKKILWKYILSESIFEKALDAYLAMDIITAIHDFFDKGIFYIIRGYMENQYVSIKKEEKISERNLKKYFFKGSSFKLDEQLFGVKVE